jgi:hypothetical protein
VLQKKHAVSLPTAMLPSQTAATRVMISEISTTEKFFYGDVTFNVSKLPDQSDTSQKFSSLILSFTLIKKMPLCNVFHDYTKVKSMDKLTYPKLTCTTCTERNSHLAGLWIGAAISKSLTQTSRFYHRQEHGS